MHTYSDSNFQKRIRRLIGSTAGEWEIDECLGWCRWWGPMRRARAEEGNSFARP